MTDAVVFEPGAGAPPDDALRSLRDLVAVAEAADGTPPMSDQALIGAAQGQRLVALFPAPKAGTAEAGTAEAGTPAATADPVAAGVLGAGELDLVVRPEARRRGIGTAALAEMLGRARGEVRAWSHGDNPGADALLAGAGFAPVRTLLRMALDPALLPDPGVEAPDRGRGVVLRVYDASSPRDAEEWVRVNAAAFADHPEQGKMTLEDFAALTREPWFDVDDLVLAHDAGSGAGAGGLGGPAPLLGFAWVKTVRDEAARAEAAPDETVRDETGSDAVDDSPAGAVDAQCELYALGVHPGAAGRGLGRLLLDAALRRMAAHRPSRVTLYVDGDNTRAVELYERAGFTVEQRSRQWARTLS